MSIRMEVWGENACFTRPEMKTERVTYDVMTPSAARGILEAVYWHPGMRWHIDKIHVLSPIRFVNLRRNEVKSKVQSQNALTVMNGGRKELYLSTSEDIQQRASVFFRMCTILSRRILLLQRGRYQGIMPENFRASSNVVLRKGSAIISHISGPENFRRGFACMNRRRSRLSRA